MIGHHNIFIDAKQNSATHTFHCGLEHGPRGGIREIRPTMPTGKCDEMRLSGIVEALKIGWHARQITLAPHSSKRCLSGPPAVLGSSTSTTKVSTQDLLFYVDVSCKKNSSTSVTLDYTYSGDNEIGEPSTKLSDNLQ